jgi:hypothetical protein
LFVTAFFPGDDGQAVSWIIHMIFVARVFKFGGEMCKLWDLGFWAYKT